MARITTKELDCRTICVFPSPVMLGNIKEEMTTEQLDFILGQDVIPNVGNFTSTNNMILDEEVLLPWKEKLEKILALFVKSVYSPVGDFETYITQSWINYAEKSQYHHPHVHSNSYLSGVYYVQTGGEDDGIRLEKSWNNTWFNFPSKSSTEFNMPAIELQVKAGDFVIFPSSQAHSVKPNTGDRKRVSLSFNTFLRGDLGDPKSLDHLRLT